MASAHHSSLSDDDSQFTASHHEMLNTPTSASESVTSRNENLSFRSNDPGPRNLNSINEYSVHMSFDVEVPIEPTMSYSTLQSIQQSPLSSTHDRHISAGPSSHNSLHARLAMRLKSSSTGHEAVVRSNSSNALGPVTVHTHTVHRSRSNLDCITEANSTLSPSTPQSMSAGASPRAGAAAVIMPHMSLLVPSDSFKKDARLSNVSLPVSLQEPSTSSSSTSLPAGRQHVTSHSKGSANAASQLLPPATAATAATTVRQPSQYVDIHALTVPGRPANSPYVNIRNLT